MCTLALRVCFGVAIAMLPLGVAGAQEFPSRPITILVGLAAGGITDVTTRLYAEVVSRSIGQRITVENRAGAGGAVAAAAVQNAPPDGYTLLVFSGSQHATIAAMQSAPYDPIHGFQPISLLFESVVVLSVPADSPSESVSALLAMGKNKPGGLTFGTPGLGSPSHLLGARILLATNTPAQTVHYRGGAPMMADLITGRLDFAFPTVSVSRPYFADAKLKGLAIDSVLRSPLLPNVPTLDEVGLGKEKVANWFGLAGPAGMPKAVLERLHSEFVAAGRDPELVRRLADNGTPIVTSSPEEMKGLLRNEVENMKLLVNVLSLRNQ